MRLLLEKKIMRSALARALGRIVVGWIAGRLLLSGGEPDQLPVITVPAAIVIVFARSFMVVPRGEADAQCWNSL